MSGRERMVAVLRGIAYAKPPRKGTPAGELALQLASVRLAARVVLEEWGIEPPDDGDLERELRAERELSKKLAAYGGKWVAVRAHDVVASADTLTEIAADPKARDSEAIFRVLPSGMAFFGAAA